MRALVLAALMLAGCASPPQTAPTPAPTREPGTLAVTALLELSGPRSALGIAQRDALQVWVDQQQGRGTLRVRWTAVDVAGSEARIVVELRRATEEQPADAVILGVPLAAYDDTLLRAVELAKIPVLLTLPAPAPPLAGGRWLFALAPTPERIDAVVSADLAARGIADPPFRLAPRDADAVRNPAQLAGVRAMRLSGVPRDYPLLADVLKRVSPVPVAYLSYLTDPRDLGDLKDPALVSLWPGSRHVVGGLPGDQTSARRDFVKAFTDRHGPPATWAATAFDALALAAAAAEHAASAGAPGAAAVREGIRDGLEGTVAVGIATTYAFTPASHVGPLAGDLSLLRWSGSFVTAAR